MPTNKKKPFVKKDSELLPVKLTEAEVTEFGRQMAKQERDLRLVRDEKKNAADDFKAQENKIALAIADNAMKIRDGQEYRQVGTETTFDLVTATATTKRTDTGEFVRSTSMTADEIRDAANPPLFGVLDGVREESLATA